VQAVIVRQAISLTSIIAAQSGLLDNLLTTDEFG
jgi:hypothetical protein